ncbi:MAG: starch synthase, partial [Ruminococcus sp.]|nr:starch synthase [Ruminococcus sp.]
GLTQLMALRYGTLPIVRETGGLKDTVQPYNEFEGTGTGFSFSNYNADEMLNVINYSKKVYYENRAEWDKMVKRGMETDYSWSSSAKQYEGMYSWLLGW